MAHEGTFATSDECTFKAGKDYDDSNITEAHINALCYQAEAEINVATKYNWTDAYSELNEDVKRILSEAASNLVAIYMINFNMDIYPSRIIAEDMVNVLRDGYLRCISILTEHANAEFAKNA